MVRAMDEPDSERRLHGDEASWPTPLVQRAARRAARRRPRDLRSGRRRSTPFRCGTRGTKTRSSLATSSSSRKVRNLERDARATFVLHDSRPGFEVCGASIVGTVGGRAVAGGHTPRPARPRALRQSRRRRGSERLRSSSPRTTSHSALARLPPSRGTSARALQRVHSRSLHGALPLVPTDRASVARI